MKIKEKLKNTIHYIYFYIVFYLSNHFNRAIKNNYTSLGNIQQFTPLKCDGKIPKIIWIFWLDKKIPILVLKCIARIKLLNPNYKVTVLNSDSISEYIDININELIKIMPIANLSDLIRLKLLKKYGGIWADASIIINKGFDDFFIPSDQEYSLVGYYNALQTDNSELPVIESWLLAAPPNSEFISTWLEFFAPIENLGSKRYYESIKATSNYTELSKGLSNPSYLVVYMAAKLAYMDLQKKNILLYPCDNTAFMFQIDAKWRIRKCVTNFYMKTKYPSSPIFKITNGERKYFNFLLKHNLIKANSVIGNLLNK